MLRCLRGEATPSVLACQVDLTVQHVLLHCVFLTNARDNCFCVTLTSMPELFSKVASSLIIDFIKKLDCIIKFKCNITCQSKIVFQLLSYYKSFLTCLVCSTSTILGNNLSV